MDFSRRRQLAPPLILFYMSAVALIVLSYLFDEHIIAEFAIMHGLEPDLARQEFLKRILKGAAFIVAITVAVMLNRYFTLILLVSFIIGFPGLQTISRRASLLVRIFSTRLTGWYYLSASLISSQLVVCCIWFFDRNSLL